MGGQDIEDIYELSPLQFGMLFHTLYAPESRLYFEQVLVPIEAAVDRGIVRDAWSRVIAANDVLRTSFHWEGIEKPVQVVHGAAQLSFTFRDLSGGSDTRQAAAMGEFCEADRQSGFDMAKAPLLRVALFQLSPASYRVLLSFHHAILDGWSLQHVYRQFLRCYEAIARGATPAAPKVAPYKAYICWLQKQDIKAAEAYWRDQFRDHEAGARLFPPRQDADSFAADGFAADEHCLSAEETTALRLFAQQRRLTLNTLVQAAWAILLARMTGLDDVVFGSIVSGRPTDLAESDEMVGMFINTLPVRIRLPRRESVTAWLGRLQAAQVTARQYHFASLVQIQTWAGLAQGEPLFDTIVAYENYPMPAKASGGPKLGLVERTNYPLGISVVPGERLAIRLLYNRRFFDDAAIARLFTQYAAVLNALGASEDDRLEDLDLLAPEDRETVAAINDTRTDYPLVGITDLFDHEAAAHPHTIALQFPDGELTYEELGRCANRLAHRLLHLGVRRSDRVGLLLGTGVEVVVAMLATLKAGAAYVPIELDCPAARVAAILQDAAVAVTITSPDLVPRLAASETAILVLNDVSAALGDEPASDPGLAIGPDDVAYVMFTSGSTGRPKGAVVPHRAVVRLVRDNAYLQIAAADKVAQASNFAFDAATFEVWGALLNGATLVGIERAVVLSPSALARVIRERGITVLFLTTAVFNEVVAERQDAFRTLRALLFGGEQVDPRRVRQMLNAAPDILCHVYGPTEATAFATCHRVSSADHFAATIPIGRPISNAVAYVLDPAMRPVSVGQIGELYVGGDGLAHGYLRNPAATAQSFVPDPFSARGGGRLFRTGDKVRWAEGGAIEFVGRYDDQIKLRGNRIELGEIDFWLKRAAGLNQSLVMVRKGASGESRILAYIVPHSATAGDVRQSVRDILRRHLPSYMQPDAIILLPSLPLTPNGKIDRRALPEPVHNSAAPDRDSVAPRTATEQRLAGLWREVLGVSRISVHDNFFDLGGHSLRATQLASRIRREFGLELPLRAIFERPTIAEQVHLLDAALVEPPPAPLPPIKPADRPGRTIHGRA
jgi:amino acid adenylation domain-containing protein